MTINTIIIKTYTKFFSVFRMFQQISGLQQTGEMTDEVWQQMEISRCGAKDVVHGYPQLDPDKIYHYQIQEYPDEKSSLSLLDNDMIDKVVLSASQLWNRNKVRIMKSDNIDDVNVVIKFCELRKCLEHGNLLGNFIGDRKYGEEELARPVMNQDNGVLTIYLDSQQAWADDKTLSALTYSAGFSFHTQLLQVMSR